LNGKNKLETRTGINKVISTKLPNVDLYPKLSRVIVEYIIRAEMTYYNKILHQLYENRCNTMRDGIFENTRNFITSVIRVTDVTSIF